VSDFSCSSLRLWAVVGGVTVDVAQFQCSYSMNTIPKASCTLAAGQEVTTGGVSTAHALTTLLQQTWTEVYVEVAGASGLAAPYAATPSGTNTYLLFAGWATGTGYSHTYGGLGISLEITHWLAALTFSSALAESSHPQNPSQFTFNAAIHPAGGGGGAGGHFVGETVASPFFTAAAIQNDFWNDVLLPWLQNWTAVDRFNVQQFGWQKNDSQTGQAATALGLFTGDQLPFDPAGGDAELIAAAMAQDVGMATMTPSDPAGHMRALAHTTIWEKLVGELAPAYMFSVIPLPNRALVVPFIPGLREYWDPWGTEWTIPGRDIASININAHVPRPLCAFGIYAGHGARAGLHGEPDGDFPKGQQSIGGWFGPRTDGVVIIKPAPRYLSHLFMPSRAAADSTAIKANAQRSNAFAFPGNCAAPVERQPRPVKEESFGVMDKLAQALYANETLRDRAGKITGPLRFDIAPGTTAKFEGTSGTFALGSAPIGEVKFGTIFRVGFSLNAQQGSASTSFDLVHIRSALENTLDETSVERHPLYDRKWKGAQFIAPL